MHCNNISLLSPIDEKSELDRLSPAIITPVKSSQEEMLRVPFGSERNWYSSTSNGEEAIQ